MTVQSQHCDSEPKLKRLKPSILRPYTSKVPMPTDQTHREESRGGGGIQTRHRSDMSSPTAAEPQEPIMYLDQRCFYATALFSCVLAPDSLFTCYCRTSCSGKGVSDGYLGMELAYIRHHCHLDFPLYIEPLWHPNSSVFCRSTLAYVAACIPTCMHI